MGFLEAVTKDLLEIERTSTGKLPDPIEGIISDWQVRDERDISVVMVRRSLSI